MQKSQHSPGTPERHRLHFPVVIEKGSPYHLACDTGVIARKFPAAHDHHRKRFLLWHHLIDPLYHRPPQSRILLIAALVRIIQLRCHPGLHRTAYQAHSHYPPQQNRLTPARTKSLRLRQPYPQISQKPCHGGKHHLGTHGRSPSQKNRHHKGRRQKRKIEKKDNSFPAPPARAKPGKKDRQENEIKQSQHSQPRMIKNRAVSRKSFHHMPRNGTKTVLHRSMSPIYLILQIVGGAKENPGDQSIHQKCRKKDSTVGNHALQKPHSLRLRTFRNLPQRLQQQKGDGSENIHYYKDLIDRKSQEQNAAAPHRPEYTAALRPPEGEIQRQRRQPQAQADFHPL